MFIYGLADPRNNELRYVGFTSKTLLNRLNRHVSKSDLKSKTHRSNWIKSLLRIGLKPEIFMIQETNEKEWQEDEQFNISYFKAIGCRLTNATEGGEGILGYKHTNETKILISKNRPYTPLTMAAKQNLSDINKKFNQNEVDEIFKKYIDILSISELARQYNVVPSVIFNMLHEIKYKCSDSNISHLVREKLELNHSNKKFTQQQIDEICNDYINNMTIKELSKKYSVNDFTVREILSQKRYTCSNDIIRNEATIKINNSRSLLKNEKDAIYKYYWINKISANELSEQYGVTIRTIFNIVKKTIGYKEEKNFETA